MLTVAFLLAWLSTGMLGCGDNHDIENASQTPAEVAAASAPNLPAAFAIERDDLAARLGVAGRTIPQDVHVSESYVVTVRCSNGISCCVSPNRGGTEGSGIIYLPDDCRYTDAATWMPHAFRHELLHAWLPKEDPCHEDVMWRTEGVITPPYPRGCTQALHRTGYTLPREAID